MQENQQDYIILPTLSEQQSLALEKEHRQKLQNFYGKNGKYEINYWYDKLKQFTFNSLAFGITVHEAYILYAYYYQVEMTEEDKCVEKALIKKVDEIIGFFKQQNNQCNGVFMKLSTRSPKDCCWDYQDPQQAKKSIAKLIEFLDNNDVNSQTQLPRLNNLLYKFFLVNSKEKLQITSSQRFLKIFGHSDRIIVDICDLSYLKESCFQKIRQGKADENLKKQHFIDIWARQWEDCQWSEQIRVFYHQYQLTAITQYDQYCYFSELQGQQKTISKKVLNYFQKMKPFLEQISLSEGVMDIIIKENSIKLIEINVFDPNSRASLFNWEKDGQILKHGPLQVRFLQKQGQITKANLGSIMGIIDKKSIVVIEEALKKLNLYEKWSN